MIGDRWNVSDDEVARRYPCDELVGTPTLQAWRRSPQRLVGLPEPVVGESFSTAATRRFGRVLAVERPKHLTGEIMGTRISYVLVPQGQSTRLLMKLVTAMSRWAAPWLSVGDLVMARRQLLNLKALAERPR